MKRLDCLRISLIFIFSPRFNWQNVNFTRGKKWTDSHGVKKTKKQRPIKKGELGHEISRQFAIEITIHDRYKKFLPAASTLMSVVLAQVARITTETREYFIEFQIYTLSKKE